MDAPGTALDTDHALSYYDALQAERDAEQQFRRALPGLGPEDFDRALQEVQEARVRRARARRIERGERVG